MDEGICFTTSLFLLLSFFPSMVEGSSAHEEEGRVGQLGMAHRSDGPAARRGNTPRTGQNTPQFGGWGLSGVLICVGADLLGHMGRTPQG